MVEELKTHYAKGALFENFVITEIMKNFYNLNFFNKISGNDPEISTVIHAGNTNQKRSKGQVRSWDNLPDKI